MIRHLFILAAVVGLTTQVYAQSPTPAPAAPQASTPTSSAPANLAVTTKKGDKIANTNIPSKKEPRWVVQSIDLKSSKITLSDANSKQGIKFNLDKNASVLNNGKTAALTDVKAGDPVRVVYKKGVVQKILIESPTQKS
jgi:Cu/Ag efflux protein CusF